MTDERFTALLNGPLSHPLSMFTITRLALALRTVVDVCGEPAERALEDYCRQRDERDNAF
jgi:hypothetical protein